QETGRAGMPIAKQEAHFPTDPETSMNPANAVAKEHFMDWLRDAHAMEEQAETMLKAMEQRLDHYPELRTRISQHIQETRHQAERLRHCIQDLGGGTSLMKDMAGKFMASMQGF